MVTLLHKLHRFIFKAMTVDLTLSMPLVEVVYSRAFLKPVTELQQHVDMSTQDMTSIRFFARNLIRFPTYEVEGCISEVHRSRSQANFPKPDWTRS